MIITIGGTAGSGTTTAAKVLSERLEIPFVSAGAIFREMAAERGMTPVEFGKFAENNTDSFDPDSIAEIILTTLKVI